MLLCLLRPYIALLIPSCLVNILSTVKVYGQPQFIDEKLIVEEINQRLPIITPEIISVSGVYGYKLPEGFRYVKWNSSLVAELSIKERIMITIGAKLEDEARIKFIGDGQNSC